MSPNESALLKGSWAGVEDMVYCREIRTAEATFRVSAVFSATKIEGGGKRVRGCSKDKRQLTRCKPSIILFQTLFSFSSEHDP